MTPNEVVVSTLVAMVDALFVALPAPSHQVTGQPHSPDIKLLEQGAQWSNQAGA